MALFKIVIANRIKLNKKVETKWFNFKINAWSIKDFKALSFFALSS